MTGVFLSVPRYDWCALSHPSFCMLVNHGPSQQSSKEEYKPWKWGATANTTHLIQRPCYQRGSLCQDPAGNWTTWRFPDNRKEMQTAVVWSCLPFIRSGKKKTSCKAQWKEEELKADRRRGGKTTSGNGQAWSSASPREQWRTEKTGENWLQNHLWCPNDPRG